MQQARQQGRGENPAERGARTRMGEAVHHRTVNLADDRGRAEAIRPT
jgi:hypothetical protein